jgi:cell pole-organizing protein PopZ
VLEQAMTEAPRNDAAMAEILASMRRIVAESDQRSRRFVEGPDDPELLVLTPEMRLDAPAQAPSRPAEPARPSPAVPPQAAAGPSGLSQAPQRGQADAVVPPQVVPPQIAAPLDDAAAMLAGAPDATLDEAAVADIVRAVLRDEFNGAFGRSLTQQIRSLVQSEVAKTLAAQQQKQGDA